MRESSDISRVFDFLKPGERVKNNQLSPVGCFESVELFMDQLLLLVDPVPQFHCAASTQTTRGQALVEKQFKC